MQNNVNFKERLLLFLSCHHLIRPDRGTEIHACIRFEEIFRILEGLLMFWLIKIKALSMKKATVLASVLAMIISVNGMANCNENHANSTEYKYIPGLMELHFSDLDTDGDGRISREEFKSRFSSSGESSFKHLDKDSSLGLDRGEWNAFKVMHTGMGSHHGNHRGNKSKK